VNLGFDFNDIQNIFLDLKDHTLFTGTMIERAEDEEGFSDNTLTLVPYFAGNTVPGATVEVILKDSNGNVVGRQSTFADPAGNWAASVYPTYGELTEDGLLGVYSVEVVVTINDDYGIAQPLMTMYYEAVTFTNLGKIIGLPNGFVVPGSLEDVIRIVTSK